MEGLENLCISLPPLSCIKKKALFRQQGLKFKAGDCYVVEIKQIQGVH